MKKISTIILALSLLVATACSDLDYVPEYNLATSNFYKTEADLDAAIMGAYKDFTYHVCMNHYFYQFLMGDDLSTRPNKDSRITVDKLQPTTGEPDAFENKTWKQYWEVIYAVNTFLDKYEGAKVSDEIKNQKAAQMRFLRGYCYLVLTRNFGSVPLITKVENTGTEERAKTVEVYQLIEEDFKFAEANLLPAWDDIGRPTTWAAKAGLTYLYVSWAGWPVKDNSKYAQALTYSKDIVQNGPFSLDVEKDGDEDINDFAALWGADEKLDGNSESIFEFMFSKEELSSGSVEFGAMLAQGMFPEDLVGGNYATGWQDHNAEVGFYNRYPDEDPRKEFTFLTSWASTDNGGSVVTFDKSRYGKPTYKKWVNIAQKPTPDAFYNGMFRDLTVFRLADILLLYAEAENEVNGPSADAYTAVNRVRTRAGLGALTTGLGKTDFTAAVLNERMLELAGEGPRFWDLQRRELLGVANAANLKEAKDFVAPDPANPKNWTFPIPEGDYRLNPKIVQYFDPATMAK